jgi:hypothetical protein
MSSHCRTMFRDVVREDKVRTCCGYRCRGIGCWKRSAQLSWMPPWVMCAQFAQARATLIEWGPPQHVRSRRARKGFRKLQLGSRAHHPPRPDHEGAQRKYLIGMRRLQFLRPCNRNVRPARILFRWLQSPLAHLESQGISQ